MERKMEEKKTSRIICEMLTGIISRCSMDNSTFQSVIFGRDSISGYKVDEYSL